MNFDDYHSYEYHDQKPKKKKQKKNKKERIKIKMPSDDGYVPQSSIIVPAAQEQIQMIEYHDNNSRLDLL